MREDGTAGSGKPKKTRRWRVSKARPGDYIVALSAAAASVPVIGRHLEIARWLRSARRRRPSLSTGHRDRYRAAAAESACS